MSLTTVSIKTSDRKLTQEPEFDFVLEQDKLKLVLEILDTVAVKKVPYDQVSIPPKRTQSPFKTPNWATRLQRKTSWKRIAD